MKLVLFFVLGILSSDAFAIGCDCEVVVLPPTTGSHRMAPNSFRTYQLEEYSSYSKENQVSCRASCLKEFQGDMPSSRLSALLLKYTQNLIAERAVGHNCTGLTTLKYPVRVKARLGSLGLGNVADIVQVVSHEEVCF